MANENNLDFALPSLNFKNDQELVVEEKSEHLDKYDPLIFCRTCANIDTCLVPIFKEEGLNYSLNKKIEKYLPIHVTEKDDLPVHLCYHCASTLIAWDSLIINCIEAEKKLTLLKNSTKGLKSDLLVIEEPECINSESIDSDDEFLINKKNNKNIKKCEESVKSTDASNNFQKKIDFQTHLDLKTMDFKGNDSSIRDSKKDCVENVKTPEDLGNVDNGIVDNIKNKEKDTDLKSSDDPLLTTKSGLNMISCKYCGENTCVSKHLRHCKTRGTSSKNFKCTCCRLKFTEETDLTKHLKKKHKKDQGEKDLKKCACQICNKKFKFEENRLSHEKICGKKEMVHKCLVCGKRFDKKELADQHWTSHHKSCVCHLCGQSFGKPESLKQHIKTIHEEFKMVCHYCGKKFSRKARLQEHLQHHTGQMEFTCHVCGKGSTNAYSFGVHLATHSQETPFICSFCPRTFKHMKYVYLHERSVHLKLKSGKTYVKPKKPGKNVAQRTCPLCNKTFKRESAMLIHKRSVHEGKNGYVCKLCGKDFKYTYLLYVHKKKHHFPELCKYVCQFCEKPFPVKTELQNHLRKHTGEKPYVCSACGKTYSFHGSLNMHMKTQHENKKNFKCNVCGSSYNFLSHLARHMSVHANKYLPQDLQNGSL